MVKKQAAILIALIFTALGSNALCAENALTLEDCINLALENNAELLNADRDKAIAGSRIRQARAEALPGLALSASYMRLDEVDTVQLDNEAVEMGTLDNYEATMSLEQLLYSGGRVRAALRAARSTRDYADIAFDETRGKVIRDITRAFYRVLLAEEGLKVAEDSLGQLEAIAADFEKKEAQGLISEFDLLSARVRVAEARPRLISAQNDLRMARELLSRLLRRDDAEILLDGKLGASSRQYVLMDCVMTAYENRPLIKMQDTLAELMAEDVTAARSGSLPDLRARFNYVGANSYRFVSFDDDWSWHWNAQLILSWNIFDGGLTSGRVLEKRLNYLQAVEDADDTRRAVRLEVTTAYNAWLRAGEMLATADADLELAQRAVAIAQRRHSSGLLTTLELTDAVLAERAARLRRLQAVHDSIVAESDLLYATGDMGL